MKVKSESEAELKLIKKKKFIFIFGCAGSSLSAQVFSSCSEWASHCGGFSCCGAQALGA